VFSTALGLADIEQGVPLKTTSVHRLASLSKPITGTIIMDLVAQGKLNLDAPIRRYLPELPETYEPVTLRQLLDHQSGIGGDEGEAVAFSNTHYKTSRAALKIFVDHPLKLRPGSKTMYSSLAFTVAGAAAESVTGQRFQRLSADFFARHSLKGLFLDDPLAIVAGRVRGYLVDSASKIEFNDGRTMTRDYLAGTTGPITNARAYDISNRYPAGGFDSSAEDLMRFVIAVATAKVLPAESVNRMWSPQQTSDGKPSVFGIGWGVSQRQGKRMVGMNGTEPSTTTFLRYFPDSGSGVAVLCNAEGAQDLSKLLDDILQEMFR
ncbi:MAG: beta-lactamase family protein, partial [Acidobacteriaceae bacterium]|nr:beta-lactamase family protein [Acidobacteriaceae bacterium]